MSHLLPSLLHALVHVRLVDRVTPYQYFQSYYKGFGFVLVGEQSLLPHSNCTMFMMDC